MTEFYIFAAGLACGGVIGALAVLLPVISRNERRWVRQEERA